MFRELCGEKTLENVILMTNVWGRVTPQDGLDREQQLRDEYFLAAIAKGARGDGEAPERVGRDAVQVRRSSTRDGGEDRREARSAGEANVGDIRCDASGLRG